LSLANLAATLTALGRPGEALELTQDGLVVYHRQPSTPTLIDQLAFVLLFAAEAHAAVGQVDEALESSARAAAIWRPLAGRQPRKRGDWLERALELQASCLLDSGDPESAAAVRREINQRQAARA
jgi:tetratricopeptide (TPR) repeat protein